MLGKWRRQRPRDEEEVEVDIKSFINGVTGRYLDHSRFDFEEFRKVHQVHFWKLMDEGFSMIKERTEARSDEAVRRSRAGLARIHKALRLELARLPEGRYRMMIEISVKELRDADPDLK